MQTRIEMTDILQVIAYKVIIWQERGCKFVYAFSVKRKEYPLVVSLLVN